MDFELNTEQTILRDSVRRFMELRYSFAARKAQWSGASAGPADSWHVFAENGWLGAALPAEYGGGGGGVVATALIAQELGRALAVEPYLGCAVLAVQTLVAGASPEQLRRFLPDVAAGVRRIALAHSEPQSRGLPEPITLRAEGAPDGYTLHGYKSLVLGGGEADDFIVSAIAGDTPVLLLLDAASSGLTRSRVELHDGSQAAQLTFDGVFVPSEALLCQHAGALTALRCGLAHGIVALCAELVGVMERSIEMTAEFLKTRIQFGVPIGSFQALQHRLVDMAAELELARSMVFALIAAIDDQDDDTMQRVASQAKSLVGRAAKNICGHAIQLHGGIGITEECAIGHYFKRAVVANVLLGSSDCHDSLRAAALEHTLKTAELCWYEMLPVWWTPKQSAPTY